MSEKSSVPQRAAEAPQITAPPNSPEPFPNIMPSPVLFPNGSYGDIFNREQKPITTSAINGALPNGEYTFRPPSPPHIHIPQTNDEHQFILPALGSMGYASEDEAVLRRVTTAQNSVVNPKDWRYEWRRRAQPVLTFLYLGPSSCARDLQALKAEGITLLLVIRNTMTAQASLLSGEKVAKQLGIEAAAVDVAGNQELIAAFPRAIKIINDHLISSYHRLARSDDTQTGRTTWGKVLVFCESGNERSAAVVTAYLMQIFGLDMVSAIQYIQSQRFCIALDDGLKNLLQAYGDILGAQRVVSLGNWTASQGKRRQRVIDQDEDVDMDTDSAYADDLERFSGRGTFAPFHDQY